MNITNEKQAGIGKKKIESIKFLIAEAQNNSDLDPHVLKVMTEGFNYEIEQITQELEEYYRLKGTENIPVKSLEDFLGLPIKVRIAKGYTQKEFAEAIGVTEQQVQRWEINKYRTINLNRMLKILADLNIRLKGSTTLRDDYVPCHKALFYEDTTDIQEWTGLSHQSFEQECQSLMGAVA